MQRLRARHRVQALFIGAAEQNGNAHRFVPPISLSFVIPGHAKREPGISRFRVWSFGPSRNDNYAEIPSRLISQCSSIPEFCLTRARTVSPSVSISQAVASPVLIRKLQCISDTCAPPTRKPRQPAASISFQALLPGGFL